MVNLHDVIEYCKDCIVVIGVTIGSLIGGKQPPYTTFRTFLRDVFTTLSYVSLVIYGCYYYDLFGPLAAIIGFSIGRWSYILDSKVLEIIEKYQFKGK